MSVRLDDAIVFAARIHRGQSRKNDGLPYITHPIRVMETLVRIGVKDEDVLVAAVLHDTVEDSKEPSVTRWDIQALFGYRVMSFVEELSFMSDLKKGSPERKAAKRAYLAGFKDKSPEACLVKLIDRLDNLSCSPDDPKGYAADAKVLLDATAHHKSVMPPPPGEESVFDSAWTILSDFCEYPEAYA